MGRRPFEVRHLTNERKFAMDASHEAGPKWDFPNRGPGTPLPIGTKQLQRTPDSAEKNLHQPILGSDWSSIVER